MSDPKISTFEKATIVVIYACMRVCVFPFQKRRNCGSVVDNTLNYRFIGWLVVLGLTAL